MQSHTHRARKWQKFKSLLFFKLLLITILITTQSRRCNTLPPAPTEKDVTVQVNNFMGSCTIATINAITNSNVNYTAKITTEYGNNAAGSSYYLKNTYNVNSQSATSFNQVIKISTNLPTRVTVIVDAQDCSLCPATSCPNFNDQQNPGLTNSGGKPYWKVSRQFTSGEANSTTNFAVTPSIFPRVLNPTVVNGVPQYCTCTTKK